METLVTNWMCDIAFRVSEEVLRQLLQEDLLPSFEEGDRMNGAYAVVCDKSGLLHEGLIGSERGRRFAKVVEQKAIMAVREKCTTRKIVGSLEGLHPGDTKWPGGIWVENLGIAVAVSGLWSRWDEALARVIAAVIEAQVRTLVENESVNFMPSE